jgi:ferritin-like metal-binding protein YciE
LKFRLDCMKALYVEHLAVLLNAERQLLRAIPRALKAAASSDLRDALAARKERTCTHVQRLERLIARSGDHPPPARCIAMEGLIDHAAELLAADGDPAVRDAGIITAAQRIEHYEIAGYGCARTFAGLLGRDADAGVLQSTLDEVRRADRWLSNIAETSVNARAALV